jgi:6-phosphogluconolactonase
VSSISARELVVVADPAAAAAARFLRSAPRTVALAGGSTPRALYGYLARCTYPWAETSLFFGDERCVAPNHPDSNYRMVEETLLSRVSTTVYRMPGDSCAAASYEEQLLASFDGSLPEFDLVLLGLGPDGHTASLFPGAPELGERDRLVVAVDRPDHRRLSLTFPVLSAAREVIFLVAGAEKRDALAQLLADGDIPAAQVAARRITIFCDSAAAPAPSAHA